MTRLDLELLQGAVDIHIHHGPDLYPRIQDAFELAQDAKAAGMWCYGAAAGGRIAYDAVDYGNAALIVLGAEGSGLRPRVAAACDQVVAIPLRGRIESLSVSAAAAILLYEAARSRPPRA